MIEPPDDPLALHEKVAIIVLGIVAVLFWGLIGLAIAQLWRLFR